MTDHTPNDRYSALVVGRKVTQERLGPRTVLYRGQGLRFRMLGGGYRVVARGSGITVSAVGRGVVMLDAEPRFAGDEARRLLARRRRLQRRADALHAAPDGARALHARAARAGAPEARGVVVTTPHSVLVVEDETSIASFVAAYLRNAGYA